MTSHNVRQRSGSVMMRHDRGELRTDFQPLRLTVTYQAPCSSRGTASANDLIAAQADSDLAGAIDDLAARLR